MRLSLVTRWRLERSRGARLALLATFFFASIGSPDATAQVDASETQRPVVLIASPPPGTADLTALLEGELSALALDVVKESGSVPGQTEAAAVLRIIADPRTVTVWTAATMRLRTYAADPRRPAGSDEALARQVAEVVRAELLLAPRVRSPPPSTTVPEPSPSPTAPPLPTPPPPLASPPARLEVPSPEVSRLDAPLGAVAIAPALTTSPGPVPVLAQMQIDLRLYPWRGLRAQVLAILPIVSAVTGDDRGDIVTSTGFLGATVGYDLLRSSPLRLVPSLGAAWQWIGVTGRANPPFESSRDSTHAALLFGGVDADYAVTSWLSLVVGTRVGVVLPQLRLAIAGDELGTFGRPAVQLFAGVATPIRGIAW